MLHFNGTHHPKKATKLLVPPVSLRNEIKTDGFEMVAIEFMYLVGVLHEEKYLMHVLSGTLILSVMREECFYASMDYLLIDTKISKRNYPMQNYPSQNPSNNLSYSKNHCNVL